jgi:TetR/AcrR family transcriptional regulator, transcriptional repressor for nem operon
MPRERQFDTNDVINSVADVFLVHGYEATSMAMLCEATGLGKQSLYNSFGDKKALYLQAVDCSVARMASLATQMQAASSGRAAVQIFFETVVNLCSNGRPADQSCIVSHGLLESSQDRELRLALQNKWHQSHELLRCQVERGQRDGSIAYAGPSANAADLLMAVVSGLRVSARVQSNTSQLRATAALALSVLDAPPAQAP